jgi:hypothetical protein
MKRPSQFDYQIYIYFGILLGLTVVFVWLFRGSIPDMSLVWIEAATR